MFLEIKNPISSIKKSKILFGQMGWVLGNKFHIGHLEPCIAIL